MADLKTRLLDLAQQAHAFQRVFVADLSPDERNTPGSWENWSIKDETAHVIAWQSNTVARLAALLNHEDLPDFSDIEKINRAVFNTNRDRPLAEIVADGDQAVADFSALIGPLSDDDLTQPGRFSDQEKRPIVDLTIGDLFWHPVTHFAYYYLRHGAVARATEMQEASVAAVADVPAWLGTARYNRACFFALSGQNEKALQELEAVLRMRPDLIEWSKQDPDLAALHDEPGYQALYQ